MPGETICAIKLFADDSNIHQWAKCVDDCQEIQDGLTKLQEWVNRWQLWLHLQKCTILKVGTKHPEYKYYMMDGDRHVELFKSNCEKNLGVYIDGDLKFEHHITMIMKKANQMTGLLCKTFEYMDEDIFKTLYKSI